MATFSQNQVKDIIVTNAVASETTVVTFASGASALECQIFKADGSGVPTTVEDFYFVQKHADGSLKRSDMILSGKVKAVNTVNPKAPVLKSYSIAIPVIANWAVGDLAQLTIVLDNWGSRSFEDQYFKYAQYEVQTGDDEEAIADGLITSLTRNFSREPNTLFTFTKTGSGTAFNVVIAEVAQPYVTGKKQGLPLEFVISNDFSGTQTITERVINPGSGHNVRDLEYFAKGNVGDGYRGMGYPHNFEEAYDSVLTNTDYYLIEIEFYWDGDNHAVQKSGKELLVAIDGETAADSILTLIETATGLTITPVFTATTTAAPTTTAATTTAAPTTTSA